MSAEKVVVPDLLRDWPCRNRHLNQYYHEVGAASRQWIQNFGLFDNKSQDSFDRCDFCKIIQTPLLEIIPNICAAAKLAVLGYPNFNLG
jgi:hypothetical protein